MKKIQVEKQDIRVALFNDQEYVCLTDMMPSKDGEFFVSDWLRNRNTLEFLGIWESIHNPSFNYGEFAAIKSQSGLNDFNKIKLKTIHTIQEIKMKSTLLLSPTDSIGNTSHRTSEDQKNFDWITASVS
jgi:hypothetical protein